MKNEGEERLQLLGVVNGGQRYRRVAARYVHSMEPCCRSVSPVVENLTAVVRYRHLVRLSIVHRQRARGEAALELHSTLPQGSVVSVNRATRGVCCEDIDVGCAHDDEVALEVDPA